MAYNQPVGATEAASKNALSEGEAAPQSALGATEVDRRLRKALFELQLAERSSVLWFAEVVKRRLFKDLGFSSIYQYAGEALGFSRPRTAQFIRLCESLEGLPALKDSVAAGDVSWTKAREVAKVATPQTESAWVDLARRESRRKLERRVRMAQTRSRAKRRGGGRQLGLDDDESQAALASADSRPVPHTVPSGMLAAATNHSAAQATQPDVERAEVPVSLSLRFTPEQYARYEAILEQLRKRGERGPREELFLAGLEALLVDAGSGTANPVSAREGKPSSTHGPAQDPACEAKTMSTPKTMSTSPCDWASVSPREKGSGSKRRGAAVSPRNPMSAYQIVVQQCEDCGRARVQTSRGAKLIDSSTAEAMRCDARILRPNVGDRTGEKNGTGDKNRPGGRNRATIPPGVRREILARDGYRCRAPGCGSARFLEVHHVVSRAEGGSNRPDNLVTLCSACHRLTHSHPHPSVSSAVAMSNPPGEGASSGGGASPD